MRTLQAIIVTGLFVVLTACGSTGGNGSDDRRASDPRKVDREQFEAIRSELEKIRTVAFAAAAQAVKGEARRAGSPWCRASSRARESAGCS